MRSLLPQAKRVVVKIGTNALTQSTGGFNRSHFARLAEDLVWASSGRQLLVVSSGAIALGVEHLGLPARPKDIPSKQACAAVGQSRLMRAYEEALGAAGLKVAQVLLTHEDVQDRRRYLNARHALERLLEAGVVPIINENDTVSIDELKFGDNDALAGLVTGLVNADALIILSDVEGLFDKNPLEHPSASLIETVPSVTAQVLTLGGGTGSEVGTGGMATKLRAASQVTELGIACVIASGKNSGVLRQVLSGERRGTLFAPQKGRHNAKEAWIAQALFPKGRLTVDAGARRAVVEQKKSLLPSGLLRVEGEFVAGDPVDLVDEAGALFARGLVTYAADELTLLRGRKSSEIEGLLGYRSLDEAVHRDELVVLVTV